jgi:hypothetical protein
MIKISDIFNIEYWQRIYHSKWFLDDFIWKTPLISSWWQNNWIYWYFDIIPKYKNVISVPNTWTIWHAFYQGNDCCIDDNCLVMIPKQELSLNEMFYYVLLIRKNKYRFMYGRQITPKKLWEITIPKEIPFRVYTAKIPDYSDIKDSLDKEKLNLSDRKFEYFEVKDLFDVKWTKTTKKEPLEESWKWEFPYITTQSSNNWVFWFYSIFTEKWFVLTIDSAVTGFCSYQEKDFSASDHVERLTPNFEINKYIALFLTTIINKEQYRYNYWRKFNQERIKQTRIKLPVDTSWNPDRDFMENYIKSLSYSKYL